VFFSLVVARMLTPMMAAYILHKPAKDHGEPRWLQIYLRWAQWCLKHRVATVLGAAAFFFGSFALVPLLPTGFIRRTTCHRRRSTSRCPRQHVQANAGRGRTSACDRRKDPHVKLVYTAVGGGAAGSNPFEPRVPRRHARPR